MATAIETHVRILDWQVQLASQSLATEPGWRDRQSQLQGDFEATTGAASDSFAKAATTLASGQSSLAIKVGTKRAQARAQAKAARQTGVNKLV